MRPASAGLVLVDRHLVLATALGTVQGVVGLADQVLHAAPLRLPATRHAEAPGDHEILQGKAKADGGYATPDALRHAGRAGNSRARQQDGELFPAVARGQVPCATL